MLSGYRYISYLLMKYFGCYLGGYSRLSLKLLLAINWLCISIIFITDLLSINKNITSMVKGQINFDLSEAKTKVKTCLSYCFRRKVILHLL